MGTPLRKPRLRIANDTPFALPSPVLLPLPAPALPRAMPYVRRVRLAPIAPSRRDFSWAELVSVVLLAALIFMFGVIAGTVFWFTYDATNNAAPVSPSAVAARLAVPPEETSLHVAPALPAVAPADIVLPAEEDAPVDLPVTADIPIAADPNAAQMVVRDGEAMDADVILEDARLKLEQGDNDVALVLYERVLVQEPENRAALEGKAYALARSGRYEAAAKLSKNLLQSDPQNYAARANLVAMLGASPSPDALTELRQMAEATPDDAAVQAALGKALALRGEIAEAIPPLDRATRLAPGDVRMRFDLAVLYDRAGQGTEALALYRQILQLAGDGDAALLAPETLLAIRRRAGYLEASRIQE